MKSEEFSRHESLVALAICALFTSVLLSGRLPRVERMELSAYDLGVAMTHRTQGAAEQIAIVSLGGRGPRMRGELAAVLEKLARTEAREIAVLVPLSEPEADPGLESIRRIRGQLDGLSTPKAARAQLESVRRLLGKAESDLDVDAALSKAMARERRLYLSMGAAAGGGPALPEARAPEFLQAHRLAKVSDGEGGPELAAAFPLPQFAERAAGIGHLGFPADSDGGVRSAHAALRLGGAYYPSLPLLLAAARLGLRARDIEVEPGSGARLGKLLVPIDHRMRMFTGFFPQSARAFASYSSSDVLSGKAGPAAFRRRTVLVAPAPGAGGPGFVTPVTPREPLMSEAELVANTLAGVLNQDFYRHPPRMFAFEAALMLAVACYLMFAFPRLSAKTAALTSLIALLVLTGAEQYLMVSQRLWLRAASAAALLVLGHGLLTAKRYFLAARLWLAGETDSVYANRMLGLSFQGQGQLDMAMDHFRKLPPDPSALELMYNLALDFERKRQFHKAVAAYEYILGRRAGFRDAAARKKRLQQADPAITIASPDPDEATMLLDGAEKPTLGRYRVERELGRGSMGKVYLGRDPKINRFVAIKTLALSQAFDSDKPDAARKRFFREAEAAGRLHHPNIVTIYDVGEEGELSYIAMEYIEGSTLKDFIKPAKPLMLDWILEVSLKVADALDYAHRNGIVHRDIKPANILCPSSGPDVKMTDFGIARIMAANLTSSSSVLGTPSYMSPEQVANGPVDGRSDLFSFGVTLFEMIAGSKPFIGDSLTALAHLIADAPAPDLHKLRPDAPSGLVAVVRRLLQKSAARRYSTGEELKKDLRKCLNNL